MTFNIELRIRINQELEQQVEFLKKKLNEVSNASLVRRLIQEKYHDVGPDGPSARKTREEIVLMEGE